MKKILIFGGIIIVIFIALFFLTKENNSDEDNLYQNQISVSDLKRTLKNKENVMVYFYQTDCIHCKRVSPVVIPMAKEMGIDLKVLNLQESPSGWDEFYIQGTPSIVVYDKGKELKRIEGEYSEEQFKEWFRENK